MSALIRSFSHPDRRGLIAAIDAVCAEGHWMATHRFEPTPDWQRVLDQPHCTGDCLLVVDDGGRPVGWCRIFGSDRDPVRRGELGIGLLPEYRDRGLGFRLLRQALLWARNSGLDQVVLATRTDNARAIHLFEKGGFSRVDIIDGLLHMSCDLHAAGG